MQGPGQRTANRVAWLGAAVIVLCVVPSCFQNVSFGTLEFSCEADDDCIDGFRCIGLVCLPPVDDTLPTTGPGRQVRFETRTASEGYPTQIEVGELTGDGKVDVVIVDDGDLAVVPSTGALGFGPEQRNRPRLGGQADGVLIGDLNGDGRNDLVAGCSSKAPGLGLFLSGSSGLTGKDLPDAGKATLYAAADFTGDGRDDVVFSTNGSLPLSLLRGPGDLGSTRLTAPGDGRVITGLEVGDFDQDGKRDLLVTSGVAPFNALTTTVWAGLGDGTFRQSTQVNTGCGFPVVQVGQFAGSPAPDVAVYCGATTTLTLFTNNGSAVFTAGTPRTVAAQSANNREFGVADLDGDGYSDAILGSGHTVRSTGMDFGAPQVAFQQLSYPAQRVRCVELNADGHCDLIFRGLDDVRFSAGVGDGRFFQSTQRVGFGRLQANGVQATNLAAAGDFDEDGKVDLALGTGPRAAVILQRAGAAFEGAEVRELTEGYGGSQVGDIASGDLDGDGHLDLLLTPTGSLAVLLGSGQGTFRLGWTHAFNGQRAQLLDVNDDGRLDIVGRPVDATLLIFLNDGGGGWTELAPTQLGLGGNGLAMIAAADFNADGHVDLAAGVGDSPQPPVALLAGNGRGQFTKIAEIVPEALLTGLATAALDTDGKPDLVLTTNVAGTGSNTQTTVQLYFNRGDASFEPTRELLTDEALAGRPVTLLMARDFDGDGDVDVAVGGSNELVVIPSTNARRWGRPTRMPLALGNANTWWSFDATGDGLADLVGTIGGTVILRVVTHVAL